MPVSFIFKFIADVTVISLIEIRYESALLTPKTTSTAHVLELVEWDLMS